MLDDAYNANADSMAAALETLQAFPCAGRRVAVLGDMGELGAHSQAAHEEVGRRAAESGRVAIVHRRKKWRASWMSGRAGGGVEGRGRICGSGGCRDCGETIFEIGRRDAVEGVPRHAVGTAGGSAEATGRSESLNALLFEPISVRTGSGNSGGEGAGRRRCDYSLHHLPQARAHVVTALLLSLWFGPKVIAWLKELSFGQNYRDRAEEFGNLTGREPKKFGTPTMGGLPIVLTLSLTTLLWAQWNTLVQLTVVAVVVLAALGFYDDYTKITKASSGGAKSRVKLLVQTGLAVFIGIYLWQIAGDEKFDHGHHGSVLQALRFATGAAGVGLVLTVLAIVGSSNAVNLTDGLDGLAIGCTLIVAAVFLILTYLSGNVKIAAYLQIPHVQGAGELTVFCAALCGAALGFLWFNCHPAEVFMGDTGSLALGRRAGHRGSNTCN